MFSPNILPVVPQLYSAGRERLYHLHRRKALLKARLDITLAKITQITPSLPLLRGILFCGWQWREYKCKHTLMIADRQSHTLCWIMLTRVRSKWCGNAFFLREHQLCKQNSSKIDFCELTYNNTYDVVKLLLSTRSALHSFLPLFFFLSIGSACSVLLVTQRHSSSEDIDSRLWIMEVEPETRLLVRGSVRQKHRAAVLTSPGLSRVRIEQKANNNVISTSTLHLCTWSELHKLSVSVKCAQ